MFSKVPLFMVVKSQDWLKKTELFEPQLIVANSGRE